MSLNAAPSSDRIHIGIFGKRNAGKSSLINAVTSQNLAIVSDIKGTTTDPVQKAMELLPLGPVVMIDTPGLDDEGELGALRIRKAYQVLNKTDIAVLVVDSSEGMTREDERILEKVREKKIPYVIAFNKSDLTIRHSRGSEIAAPIVDSIDESHCISVSALTGEHIWELKELIAKQAPTAETQKHITADLIHPGDFVVLVIPIDSSAPKGRLILPQQQTIRDILESNAVSIVVKEHELSRTLCQLGKKPAMVITDSQVFARVSADTPSEIPLTSFSILFARYKGNLETAVQGAAAIGKLKDGDKVLISEGCTHHRQCDDIGSVKIPRWMKEYTGKQIEIQLSSGTEFPEDLSEYSLIIHCGGCMLNEREMKYRQNCAKDQKVPITNYGIAIAYMQGILRRSVELFPQALVYLSE